MMNIIDPHLHLFDLRKGHYHWLKPGQLPNWPDKHLIHRYFSESDLSLSAPLQLAGFVHIEAGFDNTQPWREIDWLESHCKLPFRSVAFADICAKDFFQLLDKLIRRPSVCGVRYILDKQADTLLGNELVQQNLQLLAYRRLSFDAQFSLTDSNAVAHLCQLLNRTPQLKVIINHAGWPPVPDETERWARWQDNLRHLSQYDNVAIKLSGWELLKRQWQVADILPVLSSAMDIMGEHRVMLASNFPLCLWRSSYQQLWLDYTQNLPLAEEQLKQLCRLNAAQWYKFEH
jgi:L-fuconolactonase